jgi:hypothetical protein
VYPTDVRRLDALRGDPRDAARYIMQYSNEHFYGGGYTNLVAQLQAEKKLHGFMPTLLAEQVMRGHRMGTEFPPNSPRRDVARGEHAKVITERFGNQPALPQTSTADAVPMGDTRTYLPFKEADYKYTGGSTNVIDPETGDVWLPDPYIPGQGQWLPMNTRTDTLVDPSASSLANESVSTKRGK